MLRMLRISDTNWLFVKALLSESIKNSPRLSPQMACSMTRNGFVTEYCTQNLWKRFSAALHIGPLG